MAYGSLIKLAKEGDRNAQAIQKSLQEMARIALPDPPEYQSDIHTLDLQTYLPKTDIPKGATIDTTGDEFDRLVIYQGKLLRSITNLRQSKGAVFKDVMKLIAANETELAQVDRVLRSYTDLIRRLREYGDNERLFRPNAHDQLNR